MEKLSQKAHPSSPAGSPAQLSVHIFCFNLEHLSFYVQFAIASLGLFFFFVIYGYMQELIFTIPGFQPYGMFLTLIQFVFYTIFALFELKVSRILIKEVASKDYMLIALLTVGTIGFSNASVGYLNYPTQVIFKCCKLIPTMIGGTLILKKKYGLLDVLAVLCMVVGLICFVLADSHTYPRFNYFGILLICVALCSDGAIGNFQERLMRAHNLTNSELVYHSYAYGCVVILVGLAASGQLFAAVSYLADAQVGRPHAPRLFAYTAAFSASGYLGMHFVLLLVKHFGALPAVTVSTCRKAVTICVSFVAFSKPFTARYVWAGLLVLLGVYLSVFSKKFTAGGGGVSEWASRCCCSALRFVQMVAAFVKNRSSNATINKRKIIVGSGSTHQSLENIV